MTMLIIGLVVFFAIHLLPTFQQTRTNLVMRWGLGVYKGVFSLVAGVGLALIIMGMASAPFVSVWPAFPALAPVTKLLMLPAMVLLVAAYIPSNIKRRVKHPMLTAIKIWTLAHLLVNGDLASMLLFGSFLAYAVVDMVASNRRGTVPKPAQQPLYMDMLVLLVGGAAYALIGVYHQQLFGVAIH